jgi:hypothetical protein
MIRLAQLFRLKNWNRVRQAAKQWKFGMTSAQEQQWLRTYAAQTYRGAGVMVDLGCFLGATTIALAEGLTLNRSENRSRYMLTISLSGTQASKHGLKEKKSKGYL